MTATRVALLSLLLAPSLAHGQGFALKDGDHVVFYGDDITEDGQYARAVEEYVATRFPAWNIDFFYAGVSGDKVSGGDAGSIDLRLDRDVIAAHPNVVVIMLGMNDGGYRPFDQALFAAYAQRYRGTPAGLERTPLGRPRGDRRDRGDGTPRWCGEHGSGGASGQGADVDADGQGPSPAGPVRRL